MRILKSKDIVMRKTVLFLLFCGCYVLGTAQKKPLDHTVYDSWQSIGEKVISNDGKWVVYSINPQEGDNELVIRSADASYTKSIPRGYNAIITEDSRYLICKIKPLYKDTREAKIKKKKPDDSPKDSLAIVQLGKDSVWKTQRVKTFKTPEKSFGWVAWHLEKKAEPGPAGRKGGGSDKRIDSLNKVIDSLYAVIESMPKKKNKKNEDSIEYGYEENDADDDEAGLSAGADVGTDLILRNLSTGEEKIFRNVLEYAFSKNGQRLLVEQSRNNRDTMSRATVLYYDLRKGFADTISRGANEFKSFTLSEDGSQVAYLAERDAKPKELQKFYKLLYYKEGMDSATLLADKNSMGMKLGMTVSENSELSFSKSGKRLFFGTAPIQPPKDTNLVDIDLVKVDVWHYNDDFLQTTQLNRLRRDQQENFLAVYHLDKNKMEQLGSKEIPQVMMSNEGDGDQFVGVTDFGRRVESQWTGNTKKDIYAINVNDGTKKLVKENLQGFVAPGSVSPSGKYVVWYDSKAKNYFCWDGDTVKNITQKIKTPLYNEEHDSPSDPPPYGVMGWLKDDAAVFIYDRYDVWKIDLVGNAAPSLIIPGDNEHRKKRTAYRYIRTDPEERFIEPGRELLFGVFNDANKTSGLQWGSLKNGLSHGVLDNKTSYEGIEKAKDAEAYILTLEDYTTSPNVYVFDYNPGQPAHSYQLSSINPQQKDYNWGTAELFKWTAYNGKKSEGIVYKPEDFDPKKKYPMICYFYETLSDGLYSYMAPAPTPSRLNIPFFVSRGYVVFAPDIHYGTGHPGKDAYDYVVSGARAVVKAGYVDSTKIGIQGQSWGGYQVAYLVTVTNLFKAAWAGAPVANMTSAYGGIRWESGLNRQFQYEKTQSRIGATLWEKPQLYIDNSPLFRLPKVKTPLVIMSNDADGAVPWYQGIEMFTAMRRLGKQVWLLNYNGEAHNLVERRNRKDIQVREQQYFDWLLKGEKPARWITEGVPAVNKGRDWGLDTLNP
jgi:dipeptidyl aminopeptidase/acylaminoacyl peptidase